MSCPEYKNWSYAIKRDGDEWLLSIWKPNVLVADTDPLYKGIPLSGKTRDVRHAQAQAIIDTLAMVPALNY